MNLRLKRMFIERGLPQRCEINLEGCLKTWGLTWAHSKKSRYIISDEDWMEAALACVHCHNKIEAMSHEEMHAIVINAINARQDTTGQGKNNDY